MIVYAVVDESLSPLSRLGDAIDTFIRREDAERFIEEIRGDDPKLASHVTAADLLARPGALLTRSHLRELGLERRAIDAIFRACPVVAIPGYARPLIRTEDFHRFLAEHTYAGDRVKP